LHVKGEPIVHILVTKQVSGCFCDFRHTQDQS